MEVFIIVLVSIIGGIAGGMGMGGGTILIPLLIGSFNIADQLGDAMDARCYSGSKGRTRYKKMKLSYRDLVGTLVYGALLTAVILLNATFINVI